METLQWGEARRWGEGRLRKKVGKGEIGGRMENKCRGWMEGDRREKKVGRGKRKSRKGCG